MTVKAIPDGYTTVTPWLISRDTPRLIEFVRQAFGAIELSRLTRADGRVGHAEVRGDAVRRERRPLRPRSRPGPGPEARLSVVRAVVCRQHVVAEVVRRVPPRRVDVVAVVLGVVVLDEQRRSLDTVVMPLPG
jgi:hypothetical protein